MAIALFGLKGQRNDLSPDLVLTGTPLKRILICTIKWGTLLVMNYEVKFSKDVQKSLKKLPKNILNKFFILTEQLRDKGPYAKKLAKL